MEGKAVQGIRQERKYGDNMKDFFPRDVQSTFVEMFGKEPLMVRAPGRINLIGEHTDYNDGFVMPAAVDKEVYFGIAPSDDGTSSIFSCNYNERFVVNFDDLSPVASPRWANYLLGVLVQLVERGFPLRPFSCVFGGNIPPGAGMSSSAAIECGFGVALSMLNRLGVPKMDMIAMAQWAEHNYVGVKCGIMDQFASMMGKKEHVIVLDCRTLQYQYAPVDLKNYQVILCDTKVKHSLVDSEYNTRRNECESGVRVIRKYFPEVRSLRDVSLANLEAYRSELEGKVYQRCQYVVQEIARVQAATADLSEGHLEEFGRKMFETHDGLSRLYEVSCNELDFLVAEARRMPGVIGARMMGGGFGGCTVNLVRRSFGEEFTATIGARYRDAFGIDMGVYDVDLVDGVGVVDATELSLWT